MLWRQGWELSEATDFLALTERVIQLGRLGVVVIVEGFRALAHTPLTELMDSADGATGSMGLKLWLEISADTCRSRRHANPGNGPVSQVRAFLLVRCSGASSQLYALLSCECRRPSKKHCGRGT